MCGIIAVLRGPDHTQSLSAEDVLTRLATAVETLRSATADVNQISTKTLEAAELLASIDQTLRTVPGVQLLVFDRATALAVEGQLLQAADALAAIDNQLDELTDDLEQLNSSLIAVRDALWAIERDRLRTAEAIIDLASGTPEPHSLTGLLSIQTALSALDRLEVRGRDSAGIEIFIANHALPPATLHGHRFNDPVLQSGAIRDCDSHIAFVYKNASEIGELGDNTNVIRSAIRDDELLHQAMATPSAQVIVVGHTRWASVGVISEANAHPVDSQQLTTNDHPHVAAAVSYTHLTLPTNREV